MIRMFDDVNLGLVPTAPDAVAGYVNGRWPTEAEAERRWPTAKHLSITVNTGADAECLDVEPGDATNDQAAAWVKRQRARGVKRPVVYTSVSNASALLAVLRSAGIARGQVRLWTAHYTGREHLCGPACGYGPARADATQWTDRALGRSLDESVCRDDFFGAPPAPRPKPRPRRDPQAARKAALKARTGYWSWLAWNLGREDWKPFGRRNPAVRPNVPKAVAGAWWVMARAFVRAERK